VDGHTHHDHQKRNLQVSKKGVGHSMHGVEDGQKESRGEGLFKTAVFMKVLYIFVSLHMCAHI
jgi:hypothetical protein